MTKVFAACAFLLFCLRGTSFGQTQKGYLMVGGNFGGFTYTSSGQENKSYNFNISPSIGYYVADRLAVGVLISVGVSGVKSADGETTTASNYGLSPFIRYYLGDDERDKYFVQGAFNGGGIKQTGQDLTSYIGYGLGLGYNHFFVKAVALEIGLGYDYLHPSTGHDQNNIGVNLGLLIFLPTRKVKAAVDPD
jgi:hypothetical protein